MKPYAISLLSLKNEKFKLLIEKATRLKKIRSNANDIHDIIVKEGMSKLEAITLEIEKLDEEIKIMLLEIKRDEEIINLLGITSSELEELINEIIT